jgi:hypothetical protein
MYWYCILCRLDISYPYYQERKKKTYTILEYMLSLFLERLRIISQMSKLQGGYL